MRNFLKTPITKRINKKIKAENRNGGVKVNIYNKDGEIVYTKKRVTFPADIGSDNVNELARLKSLKDVARLADFGK